MDISRDVDSEFWKRIGLQEGDKERALDAVRNRYGSCEVRVFGDQGYCSVTLLITPQQSSRESSIEDEICRKNLRHHTSFLVQLRPACFALSFDIAHAAIQTYPTLAPSMRIVDLTLPRQMCVVEMERKSGTPLSCLLPHSAVVDVSLRRKQEQLVESFAAFIAQGWREGVRSDPHTRHVRADSPMDEQPSPGFKCSGKVGSSILQRLEKLAVGLPDTRLRDRARRTLDRFRFLEDYPTILCHGDLIPSNILVDEDTWAITGVVDWAEAEYLPFGTCLYGLELLLGYASPSASPDGSSLSMTTAASHTFTYFDNAPQLRRLFWTRLFDFLPKMKERWDDISIIRDVGVLLWYGIAWDDGAIDRVVGEDDELEVACLRTFLGAA